MRAVGIGNNSVVIAPDSCLKGRGFESLQERQSIFFFSRGNFLCWLVFRYPFYPRVTAVARKRPRSFCQKCRWQVTAEHTCTIRTWLCMKWHMVHGCMVYTERAETAAVSCSTSHAIAVSTPLRWIFKNKNKKRAMKKTRFTHVELHASSLSLLESGE